MLVAQLPSSQCAQIPRNKCAVEVDDHSKAGGHQSDMRLGNDCWVCHNASLQTNTFQKPAVPAL